MDDLHACYLEKMFPRISPRTRAQMTDQMVLIDFTAAMEWWASFDEAKDGILLPERYQTVQPPFRYTLFHGSSPKRILTANGWVPSKGEVEFSLVYQSPDKAHTRPEFMRLWDNPDMTSALHIQMFSGDRGIIGELGFTVLPLDKTGHILTDRQAGVLCTKNIIQIAEELGRSEGEIANDMLSWTHPTLFALALMHAKNIRTKPDTLPRSVRRRGIVPAMRAYTLEVTGVRQVAATGSNSSQMMNALHLCRGNFATYSEAAPLFGKYVGTYWRPAHVKGHASQGIVDKDYKVKADAKP